ncbi:hypothetical protein CSA37_03205 [Candidatus Fermentibacteria bacterium]|nr:MAG: hypothetical protein CSA37_03205 [Candidatus Fermentibacteria bacterium]
MDRLIALSLLFCSCAVFIPAEKPEGEDALYHCPWAASVQLVGDWNSWGGMTGPLGIVDPRSGLMEQNGEYWTLDFPSDLRRGCYRYGFLINGTELVHDPLNPDEAVFKNSRVSLLTVD